MEEEIKDKEFSFSKYAWKQFRINKPAMWSLRLLGFLIVLALLSPIIANDKPVYCKYKGETLFPAVSFYTKAEIRNPDEKLDIIQYDIADWKHMDLESAWWPLCAYVPYKSDFNNADYISPWGAQVFTDDKGETIAIPLKFRHWLGTNKKGEDVLSGLIHGTKISLTIGVFSMMLASFIGVFLGALAGYFGDKRLQTTRAKFWLLIIGTFVAYFYAFLVRGTILQDALSTSGFRFFVQLLISVVIFIGIIYLFNLFSKIFNRVPFLNKKVFVPVDMLVSRSVEILNSLPKLILIISLSVIAKPSVWNIVLIIGLTNWTDIARLTRAEFLRTSQLDYVQAGKSLGLSEFRIIFRHALPNSIAPAFIAIAFGIAGAILIESGLSFLGIGVAADSVTWGSLLSAARENFNAWWLVLFPGGAIFLTVTMYNLIGEGLRDALDPRLKR
ncbi:MAG TPA: ABC transporter permease [Bacteroidia bacterium]|jgi:peptide/nickel transport system permease protein|nr:ABC transporter permease [Bacteroidia bacterium]